MANGTQFETAIDRLLNVTLPTFLNNRIQENRAQEALDYARQRDEASKIESSRRFDIQVEQRENEIDRVEQRYRDQEQERLESRVRLEQKELEQEIVENEILEVQGVDNITNTEQAKTYLEKIIPTITSSKGKAVARRYMGQIDSFQNQPDSPLKLIENVFSENTIEELKSLNSWKKPLTFTTINDYLTSIKTIDALKDAESSRKFKRIGFQLDKINAFRKELPKAERDITTGKLLPSYSEANKQGSVINAQIENTNLQFKTLFEEYGKIASETVNEGGFSNDMFRKPAVGDEVGIDGVGGIVTVASAAEASKLADGAVFKIAGAPDSFTKNGDNFILTGDTDFDSIVNPVKPVVPSVPGVVEERVDSPEKTAIDRLASAGVLGRPDEESALSFLRRLPGAEREYGTGKGGGLSMGGSSKEQVVAVENLKRNTDIIMNSLTDARGGQVSQGVFEDSEQYQVLKQENNTNLQNYIQNAYEAYLDERTSPQVRGRLKKYLQQMKALSTKPSIVARATLGRGENLRPIRFTGGESIFNQDTIELLSGIEL
jgi:hypothetical protein